MKQYATRVVASAMAAAVVLGGSAQAQSVRGPRAIPQDTVIRLEMVDKLTSRTARRGDLFTAQLSDKDRSGFPERTRFEGSVIDVRRAEKNQPGVLGIKIHRAIMPDGSLVAVNGTLSGLTGDDVQRRSDGRLESRGKSSGKIDPKWIGYGAAGGAVLGTILGGSDDLLKGGLLGALGGAAYSYLNKDKAGKNASYRDVELSRGTPFGVRVHHRVSFRDSGRFRYADYDPRDEDLDYRDRDRDSRGDVDRDYDRDRDADRYERDRDLDRTERESDYDRTDRERENDRLERERDRDRDYDRDTNTRKPAR
jgi:hypothetical protein